MTNEGVVVVGANGFLGRAIVGTLRRSGEMVISFTRARPPLLADGGLHPAIAGCRSVIWLASSINPLLAETHPELVLADADYLRRFLDAMITSAPSARFIFPSSGGTIYGAASKPPFVETLAAMPTSAYGQAKLALERDILEAPLRNQVILRISNLYGPGQPASSGQGVIAHWLRAARGGEPIKIFGDPAATRDYVYVRDAAEAAAMVHESRAELPAIMNIGCGYPTTLEDLATLVVETVADSGVTKVYTGGRSFDLSHSWLSVDRAKAHLGWEASTSLRSGLREAWESVRTASDPSQ